MILPKNDLEQIRTDNTPNEAQSPIKKKPRSNNYLLEITEEDKDSESQSREQQRDSNDKSQEEQASEQVQNLKDKKALLEVMKRHNKYKAIIVIVTFVCFLCSYFIGKYYMDYSSYVQIPTTYNDLDLIFSRESCID